MAWPYTYKWQQASNGWLNKHPLCIDHLERGQVVPATVVDHKIPHRCKEAKQSGNAELIKKALALFWDKNNWQSLCSTCHDSAKQREEKSGIKPGCNINGIPLNPNHHWNKQ